LETTITFSAGGVVGFLLRTLIDHFLAKSRTKEERRVRDFNEAARRFRDAFKEELLALSPNLSKWEKDTSEILEAAFEKHRIAVFDFKPFLSKDELAGFHQAWGDYYRYENTPESTVHGLAQYSGKGHGYTEARRLRLLAAERIERLLEFAKSK
jgi:hypothetical protein